MINYLPTIYPDELVYSWFCRYYIHSGCLTSTMAMRDLLNKRCNTPSKEFIGHLNSNAQQTIEKMYSMDYLVLNHTMFPQYARFISSEKKKKALYHLGTEFCDPHHLFIILPRTESECNLKYCPMCVQEDRAKYGETYWHRKHQIRNMKTCYKHGCYLVNSEITARSDCTFTFCSAEEYVKPITPIMADNKIQDFSRYMVNVFDSSIDFENDTPIKAILYYGLSDTKYMAKTKTTRNTQQLADDLKEYYNSIGIDNVASINQLHRLWFGKRFDFSVICQIAYFIGMNAEELTTTILTPEQIEIEENTHYMKNKTPIDWTTLDNETALKFERLAQVVYNGSADVRPERVSEKLVYREYGLEKHRIEKMPLCRKILEKYKESYEENWARRIIWAYNRLKSENNPFYWSDIRKLSGVKKCNFEKAVPYLYKHTNKATANKIIMLVN